MWNFGFFGEGLFVDVEVSGSCVGVTGSVCSPSGQSSLVRFSCSSVSASGAGVGSDGLASVLGRSRHWLDLWSCKIGDGSMLGR